MNSDNTSMARSSPQQEAAAALHPMSEQAKANNLAIVADLSMDSDEAHVAEHIRGMVAATMGQLCSQLCSRSKGDKTLPIEKLRRFRFGIHEDQLSVGTA